MASKSILVARREYLENLRTKTFWIGILSFPLILLAAVFVPRWLAGAKDVRRYAVIDRSGWLLPAIEERGDQPDLSKVFHKIFRQAREKLEKGKATDTGILDEIPENLRGIAASGLESFRDMSAEDLDRLADQVAEFYSMLDTPEGKKILEAGWIPESMRNTIRDQREAIREWWETLPPGEAKELAPGLKKSRYERVVFDDLGDDPEAALQKKLDQGELFAYFVIGPDPVHGDEGCKYVSKNLTDDDLKDWLEGLATEIVRERRMKQREIDPKVAAWIDKRLRFEEKSLSKEGVEEEVSTQQRALQWAPAVFTYLLWISVMTITQMLLTNTIEEKSNRILEVLLSSISPVQLMAGKIAGIAATGLTMIGSWIVSFLVVIKVLPQLIDLGKLDLDLGALLRDPVYLGSFVLYFLFGFLLYAAILVGFGSVCNSLKEAQNLMQPVMILLIVPILAMVPVGQDPNGALAKGLSWVPFFTPFVMMNRAAGPPEAWEYAGTTLLLLASVGIAFWAAAKVFRIGILMTGKPPKIGEILRWVRAPVGAVPVRRESGAA